MSPQENPESQNMLKLDETISQFKAQLYQNQLLEGDDLEIKVMGNCMWPFLRNGDTVVIRKVHFRDIEIGDIIFTYVNQRFYCHRVYKKTAGNIQTKADALCTSDAKVSEQFILGKVVSKIVKGKRVEFDGFFYNLIKRYIGFFTLLTAHTYPILRWTKHLLIPSRKL